MRGAYLRTVAKRQHVNLNVMPARPMVHPTLEVNGTRTSGTVSTVHLTAFCPIGAQKGLYWNC
jgi:hypothetical protein